jgi:hypothetical protein
VAYVERSGHALVTRMREAEAPSAPAAQRLYAGILAFLTYAEEHSAGWTILHRETLEQGGLLAAELSELRERVVRMLTTLFGDEASPTRSPEPVSLWPAGGSAMPASRRSGSRKSSWTSHNPRRNHRRVARDAKRATGVEPVPRAWKAPVQPLTPRPRASRHATRRRGSPGDRTVLGGDLTVPGQLLRRPAPRPVVQRAVEGDDRSG